MNKTHAKRPFATVSGPRINPRNRHTSSSPHVFTTSAATPTPIRIPMSTCSEARPRLSRRQQLDIVSRRLNNQPGRASRIQADE